MPACNITSVATKSANLYPAIDVCALFAWSRAKEETGYASDNLWSLTPGNEPSAGPPRASNLCRRQASKIIARLRQQLRCLFSSRCRHDDSYILFYVLRVVLLFQSRRLSRDGEQFSQRLTKLFRWNDDGYRLDARLSRARIKSRYYFC